MSLTSCQPETLCFPQRLELYLGTKYMTITGLHTFFTSTTFLPSTWLEISVALKNSHSYNIHLYYISSFIFEVCTCIWRCRRNCQSPHKSRSYRYRRYIPRTCDARKRFLVYELLRIWQLDSNAQFSSYLKIRYLSIPLVTVALSWVFNFYYDNLDISLNPVEKMHKRFVDIYRHKYRMETCWPDITLYAKLRIS